MNEIKRLWISHKDTMSLFSGSNSISWFFKPTCLMNDTIFTIILYIQKNVHNYFLKICLIQSLSRFLNSLAGALLWQHSLQDLSTSRLPVCTLYSRSLSCPKSSPNSTYLFIVSFWKPPFPEDNSMAMKNFTDSHENTVPAPVLCKTRLNTGILSDHSGSCFALPSKMCQNYIYIETFSREWQHLRDFQESPL